MRTISPSAIHASIIESPFPVNAKISFFKTSEISRVPSTSLKVSIKPPAATEPLIGTPSMTSSSLLSFFAFLLRYNPFLASVLSDFELSRRF